MAHHRRGRSVWFDARKRGLLGRHGVDLCGTAGGQDVARVVRHADRGPLGQGWTTVDVLLSIQLGGGTDITQALAYANELVRQPQRTIVVLITDFYEGRAESDLVAQTRIMADSGMRLVGLGALGYDARPSYNKSTAENCARSVWISWSAPPKSLPSVWPKSYAGNLPQIQNLSANLAMITSTIVPLLKNHKRQLAEPERRESKQ